MKIGDRIFVRGYIDEIRKDTVIVRNDGGYFGTIPSEVTGELPSAQPEIIRCKDCKHNPKDEWFGCPMSHLNEKQRPETAWCWKGERRTDGIR